MAIRGGAPMQLMHGAGHETRARRWATFVNVESPEYLREEVFQPLLASLRLTEGPATWRINC